jgi:hypothetical protein
MGHRMRIISCSTATTRPRAAPAPPAQPEPNSDNDRSYSSHPDHQRCDAASAEMRHRLPLIVAAGRLIQASPYPACCLPAASCGSSCCSLDPLRRPINSVLVKIATWWQGIPAANIAWMVTWFQEVRGFLSVTWKMPLSSSVLFLLF